MGLDIQDVPLVSEVSRIELNNTDVSTFKTRQSILASVCSLKYVYELVRELREYRESGERIVREW